MEALDEYLSRYGTASAILFCGAGLTADCLNFDDDAAVGVTTHLLQLLNDELKNREENRPAFATSKMLQSSSSKYSELTASWNFLRVASG